MKKYLSLLLLLFVFLGKAQELKVSCNKNPAITGEQILIQYTIEGQASNFQAPNFNGLKVLSGPNPSTQSSISIINGKRESSRTTTYSFYIQAVKEGIFNISPASIKVNDEKVLSKSYKLEIVQAKQKNKKTNSKLKENLFIKVDVSKRNIVVGEQIMVTYKLFTRLDLQNTELKKLPELNGFWAKDLETSSRFKREIIDGLPYNTATIKKTVLTAQKSGKLIIDPMQLKCDIRIENKTNNRDPFANFFGGRFQIQEEIITSSPITINVDVLPNEPINFKGIVGNMNITSEIDKDTINTNDALTYKVKITGTGNIELIKPLEINVPDDFEIYDPKISEKIFEGGRKRSVKTFEYLIIPRYEGEYKIPPINLTIYNPRTKKYEKKESSLHKITVNKSNSEEVGLNHQKILKKEQKDINYINTKTKLHKINNHIINIKLFYILFFLPVLVIILLTIYEKIFPKENKDTISWKNKKANKIAQKRIKSAADYIEKNDYEGFFEETEKVIWGYFADKFKVPVSNLSKETVNKYFEKTKISTETQNNFIKLLNECEYARYAPTNNKHAKMDQILNNTKNIIIQVENELK